MMRTKPNYNKAKACAFIALERHNIQDFPINILSILESYEDIKIISYSEMAKKRNCTFEEIIEINNSTDGVIHYSAKKDKYIIAFNDRVPLKERVYWTLAHEFGHYLLNHHKETDKSSLSRNELSDSEYEVFEVEANFFARFFVSPPAIISEANMDDHNKIMEFFGISFSAARSTLEYVKRSYLKGFRFIIPENVSNTFSKFIKKVKYGKTCSDCNSFFYLKDSKYCPTCGSDQLHNFSRGDDIEMKYPGHFVDNNGKALTCPHCGNEEVHYGDYCSQCGVFLLNRCSIIDTDWNGNEYRICDVILPGNSRHCHQCGAASTFLTYGLLKDWVTTKEELDNPRVTVPSIADDELPF